MKWLPWIMAASWLVARYIVRAGLGTPVDSAHTFGVLSNVLLIVLLVFVALYVKHKSNPGLVTTFFQDFTTCMQAAMKYVIGAVIAIFVYYSFLQPDDIPFVRQTHIDAFTNGISSEESLAQFKSTNPDLKLLTREQLIAKKTAEVNDSLNVKTQIIGALLALTTVSLVYSLLSVFFWRALMKRK
jgi:hypothetical protein